jgi:predicted amidophosphoribosyltransferase
MSMPETVAHPRKLTRGVCGVCGRPAKFYLCPKHQSDGSDERAYICRICRRPSDNKSARCNACRERGE